MDMSSDPTDITETNEIIMKDENVENEDLNGMIRMKEKSIREEEEETKMVMNLVVMMQLSF